MAQGLERGMAKGAEEKGREMAINLYRMGMKPEDIAEVANESLNKVRQWLGLAAPSS